MLQDIPLFSRLTDNYLFSNQHFDDVKVKHLQI